VALWLLAEARARDLAVTIDPGSAAFLARMEPAAFLRWTEGAAVCFPNRDEAAVLTGEPDPVAMAARLTRHYGAVVVKLGGAGCVLAVPGEAPVLIAAQPAEARDTTGAGDAFCGAFMSRWLASRPPADQAGGPPADRAGGPPADLTGAAEFATQVAATVVTRFGARPP
jgi:sugar/nucleoside kinase (ribokinase family)